MAARLTRTALMKKSRWILTGLAVACAAAWVITAIHPLDRQAWILENLLVIAFAIVLSTNYRRLQFSTASYVCLALFLILHLIGAHYTYARMPLGLWAKDTFHLSRNYYDRFAHGAFGFLLVYPVRELLLRFSGTSRRWSFWLAPAIILALSGFFEIIEGIVAEIVAPGQGVNWLGGQGDEWDAQNDMLSALVGSLLMMGTVALLEYKKVYPSPQSSSSGRGGTKRQMMGTSIQSSARKIDIYFLPVALGCYVVFWIALAIRPLYRGDWFLENLLVFTTAAVLGSTYPRFQFSNVSYALILAFLTVHTIGAHYTYAKVPAGFWLQDWLHLKRNHYDRVIHFSFGFLLLYPMRELLRRSAHAYEGWATWLAVAALGALSGFFEIIEAVVAQIVRPDLGAAYLGTQGDIWDAQKDMAAALIGAVSIALWLTIRFLCNKRAQAYFGSSPRKGTVGNE